MGRYRKVSTCIWGDERVRRLSRPREANGRDLWFYLLTGPHTTNIPGLFHAGVAALAEENEWAVPETATVLEEILAAGLACFDRAARVWFLPKALEHNAPESPNVIRAWRKTFDELPDSPLKPHGLRAFRLYFEGKVAASRSGDQKHGAFLAAFRETFPEAFEDSSDEPRGSLTESLSGRLRTSLPKGSPNQEQEQEQDLLPPNPPRRGAEPTNGTKPPTRAERKQAEELRHAWGRCLHHPRCQSTVACVAEIIRGWRVQAAVEGQARASPDEYSADEEQWEESIA